MERTRIQDLCIGLVVSVVGLWCFFQTFSMPETTQPYTFCVTIVFTGLGLLLTGRSIYYRKTPSHDSSVVHAKTFINPLIAFIMILAYTLLLDKIGFFVTSAVLMVIMSLWMGYRKIQFIAVTVVGLLGFIYWLFVFQLNVVLPSGILF